MKENKTEYHLKGKDFIPFVGLRNYGKRWDTIPPILVYDRSEKAGRRYLLLMTYNTAIIAGAVGLAKLLIE